MNTPAGTRPRIAHAVRVRISGRPELVEAGLLALLVWAPLPAASVPAWSVLVIQWTALLLAGAHILKREKPAINAQLDARARRLRWLFGGSLAFFALQLVPLPYALLRVLSPATARFQSAYNPGFTSGGFYPLSLAPGATVREGLELSAYILIGVLIVRTVTHGAQIRRLIVALTAAGVFQALYGFVQLSARNPRLLFYAKEYNLGSVTGTFVNRNHFSGFLEMILPLTVGLLIARVEFFALGGKGLRDKLVQMSGRGLAQNLLLTLAVVVMALGIVFSQSRSGIFVLVFSFLLILELIVFHFSRVGSWRRWARNFVRATFLAITALALIMGVGGTVQRFALDNLLQEGRPLYWSNIVGMAEQFPLFGTGLGSFESVYPAFERLGGPELLLVHAHNDYLEYFSELGAVGFALLFGGILTAIVFAAAAWRTRRDPQAKGIALGGLVSLAGILLHSLTDFNLHIPANMLLFSTVLGLTLVAAFHRKRGPAT